MRIAIFVVLIWWVLACTNTVEDEGEQDYIYPPKQDLTKQISIRNPPQKVVMYACPKDVCQQKYPDIHKYIKEIAMYYDNFEIKYEGEEPTADFYQKDQIVEKLDLKDYNSTDIEYQFDIRGCDHFL